MKQCRPVKKLRFSLLILTLLSLDDLRDEEAEYILDKSVYRKITISDDSLNASSSQTRKQLSTYEVCTAVNGSLIPATSFTLLELHEQLQTLGITWNYDNLSDSHP